MPTASGLQRRRNPSERTCARRCRKNEIRKLEAERKKLKRKQCTLRWKKQIGAIGRAQGETTYAGRKKAQGHEKDNSNDEGGTKARSATQSLKKRGVEREGRRGRPQRGPNGLLMWDPEKLGGKHTLKAQTGRGKIIRPKTGRPRKERSKGNASYTTK